MKFLQFSRSERHGALFLALICLCAAALPVVLRQAYKPAPPDFRAFDALVDAYRLAMAAPAGAALFEFDPNRAGEGDLLRLGLSRQAVAAMLKYRARGGRFVRPADLCKIHGISSDDCARLQPYVRIAGARQAVNTRPRQARAAERFPFDPNTADAADLARLGVPAWVCRNILRYREKGGRFRSAADLAKIYGLSEELMSDLAPLVQIAGLPPAPPPRAAVAAAEKKSFVRTIPTVDINRDSAERWEQLPGIGFGRAQQILRFRDRLGGFSSVAQVAETRGLPDSVFQALLPYLSASPVFRKISLNTATRADLTGHPYISFKQADQMLAYRDQHGPYRQADDLRKIPPLNDPVWLEKIRPYLSVE
jgi:DNA uptake protein ComE-like DNA-binding protein